MSDERTDTSNQTMKMLALTGQWDELEDAWMEALDGELRALELTDTLDTLLRREETDRARVLASMAVAPLHRKEFHQAVVDVARVVAGIPGEEDPEHPDLVLASLGVLYADRPETESLLRKAIVYRRQGLAVLLRNIDAMFLFSVGDIVHHKGGWGFGRVTKIRARREEMVVTFQNGRENLFPVLTAGEYLRKISKESFDGISYDDSSRLVSLAACDASALIRLLLEDRGGRLQVKRIKDELCPTVIEAGKWNGWWSKTRTKLKWDPYFKLDPGSNPTLHLLAEPATYGETSLREFTCLPSFADKLKKVRAYISESRGRIEEGVLSTMIEHLKESAASPSQAQAADRAGLVFLSERIAEKGLPPMDLPYSLDDVVTDETSFLRVVEGLSVVADQGKLLERVRTSHPEQWPGWFEAAYGLMELAVWDRVTRTLMENGHQERVSRAFHEICAFPRRHPLAFLWMFKSLLAGKVTEVSGLPDTLELTEKALGLTNRVKMAEEIAENAVVQRIFQKSKEILTEKHFRGLFDSIGITDAKRLIDYISVSGLKRSFAEVIEQIGISKFPEIVAKPLEVSGPDPQYIFVSQNGLDERRAEYNQLLTVDIEKNRIALGKALALGDLSENAELDAAREMQNQLSRKANDMEAEFERVKVIDFNDIPEAEVGLGSGIVARDGDGEVHRYLILGPWDTDTDRGVISYAAPLGKAFYGRKAGDEVEVELPDGRKTFTLEEILPASAFGVDSTGAWTEEE